MSFLRRRRLVVKSATYHGVDVTGVVRSYVKAGSVFDCLPEDLGVDDPDPGTSKTLVVVYVADGVEVSESFHDGDVVTILLED